MWTNIGKQRPDFAQSPAPGQESVWDYPRPPQLETSLRRVRVIAGDTIIAESEHALRLLETASPPTYYLPPEAVDTSLLVPTEQLSHCEWKGRATYWALAGDHEQSVVAWSYATPHPRYRALQQYFSFYPGRVSCYVDQERVRAQTGQFYGGWITDDIVGPFKGDGGTGHW
jgi:uncharacterized protein (DUF427 family)